MPTAVQEEWKDGFPFIGNQRILDLLNTKPVLPAGPTELLSDYPAFERWLIASGTVTFAEEKAVLRSWRGSAETQIFLHEVIAFRERLRGAVVRIEGGHLPTDGFLSELNTLLLRHPTHALVCRHGKTLIRQTRDELSQPSDLWTRLAESTAQLIVEADHSRLRQCEACVLHFLDTSKKGSRRWCSMNICGNKLKVAAYQQRRRNP
ncbi:CGNR zinc finger domain-containing protein [Silvibacterium acidisoli]|uniref:CGNR zinc finger domain-containing protein n=1 Tax=Acidobacteriaceae bacterium ZG23-2 TaxID=2883246 RepID=UPI00406C0107